MALNAHDREDLLRDATGYVRRIEFAVSAFDSEVFCGFRTCGAASFYFGQDNVLQFNANCQLRRAFWKDRMLASYRQWPHWLEKSKGRVHLHRTALTRTEQGEFVRTAVGWLTALRQALQAQAAIVRGQVPESPDLSVAVTQWLTTHADTIEFAQHPGLARNRRQP